MWIRNSINTMVLQPRNDDNVMPSPLWFLSMKSGAAWPISIAVTSHLLSALGCGQSRCSPICRRVQCRGGGKTGDRRRFGDVGVGDVTVASDLRRQQPDRAALDKIMERVDQGIDKIAVVLAPPQDHAVDYIPGFTIDQLAASVLLDLGTQCLIDVLVPAQFLDDGVGLETQLCRTHRCLPNALSIRPKTYWKVADQSQLPVSQ